MNHCQQLVEIDSHWQPTYQWSHVDKHRELVTLEGPGGGVIQPILYYMHTLEVQDRGWAMSKPLEAKRISQIEMRIYCKAIPLSRSTYRAANLNPIQIQNQAIQAVVHLLSK